MLYKLLIIFSLIVNLQATHQENKTTETKNNEDSIPATGLLSSKSEINLLQSLQLRKKEIEAKERSIQQQAMLLKVAQKKVEENLKVILKIKEETKVMLDKIKKHKKNHTTNMEKIFESMAPKKAAQILNHWDPKLVRDLIKQMRNKKAADILSFMNVQKAKEITSDLETSDSKEK